jgi:hypothetical protein
VNGFDIFDRYDFVMYLLFGLMMVGALALGAPLWTALVIMVVASVAGFIRHFDEIMGP